MYGTSEFPFNSFWLTRDLSMPIVKTFINEKKYPPPWTSSDNSSHIYYANDTDTLEGRLRSYVVFVYKLTHDRNWACPPHWSSHANIRHV